MRSSLPRICGMLSFRRYALARDMHAPHPPALLMQSFATPPEPSAALRASAQRAHMAANPALVAAECGNLVPAPFQGEHIALQRHGVELALDNVQMRGGKCVRDRRCCVSSTQLFCTLATAWCRLRGRRCVSWLTRQISFRLPGQFVAASCLLSGQLASRHTYSRIPSVFLHLSMLRRASQVVLSVEHIAPGLTTWVCLRHVLCCAVLAQVVCEGQPVADQHAARVCGGPGGPRLRAAGV